MNCKNCGATIDSGVHTCPNCGSPAVYVIPAALPEQYRPMSPWGYVGLHILFSLPVIGWIFLIVFSFSDSNINRRNFARSYWCGLILCLIIVAAILLAISFGCPVPALPTKFW